MRRENWLSMSYQKCFMFSLKLSILYVLNKSGGGKKVWDDIRVKSSFFRANSQGYALVYFNLATNIRIETTSSMKGFFFEHSGIFNH